MTYKQTVAAFAREFGYRQRDIRDFMENLAQFIINKMAIGEDVVFQNFILFSIKEVNSSAFDFKNNKPYVISDKLTPVVKLSRNFKSTIVDRVERNRRHGE